MLYFFCRSVILLLATSLAAQMAPTIAVAGHTYSLACYSSTGSVACHGGKEGVPSIVRFEIADETGRIVFTGRHPKAAFVEVQAGGGAAPLPPSMQGHALFAISAVRRIAGAVGTFDYFFEATSQGLEPFSPAVACVSSAGAGYSGPDPACFFGERGFKMTLAFEFDPSRHSVTAKNISEHFANTKLELISLRAGSVRLFQSHSLASAKVIVRLHRNQRMHYSGLWAPLATGPGPDEKNLEVFRYMPRSEWVQVQIDGRSGWMPISDALRNAIGPY